MKKKTLILLLTLSIISTSFIGCGEQKQSFDNEEQKQVEEIKDDEAGKEDKVEKNEAESIEEPEEYIEEVDLSTLPFEWSTSELAKNIPVAITDSIVDVRYDDEDVYEITVTGGKEEFDKYVKLVKKAGYVYDKNEDEDFYRAYRKNGYIARVMIDDDNTYGIRVDLSSANKELLWTGIGLGSRIPEPPSNKGAIDCDSESCLSFYIECKSNKVYKDYIKQCYNNGFNAEHKQFDDYFWAKSEDGCILKLTKFDCDLMHVYLYMDQD